MSQVQGHSVAVIGGGIGGLAAALAFRRFGAQVTVFEQAPALSAVGAGIQITPNGTRVLTALGLAEDAARLGVAAAAVVPTNARTGAPITRFDLSDQMPAYQFFHRADVIDLLAGAAQAAGVALVLNARVTDVSDAGVVQRTGGPDVEFDLVIGADGLHSGMRSTLNGADAPFFTGQVAWRGVLGAGAVPEGISGGEAPEARIWMAPGRHVVTYPLSGGRLNVVAVQERDTWAAEGWHHADSTENLSVAFDDLCPALRDVLARIETPMLWGLFRHPVARHWHDARRVLVGDAAHPTLPFLAQGANLALEDAWCLAAACAAEPRAQAFPAYHAQRAPRVARAIAAANANARNYHLGGLRALVAHTGLGVLGRVAPQAFMGRMAWLYDHDVTGGVVPPQRP